MKGEVWGGEERVMVKTEVKERKKCPYCGSGKLYRHGMCKAREVLHSWSNGKRVYLELHRRRWKCRDCKQTFTEGRELVRSRSRLTRQAEVEALWQRWTGWSAGKVRRTLSRFLVDAPIRPESARTYLESLK